MIAADISGLPIGTKTLESNYQSTARNIPQEQRSQLHSGGNLKSRIAALLEGPQAVSAHLSDSII
jgi:hypothetical protein